MTLSLLDQSLGEVRQQFLSGAATPLDLLSQCRNRSVALGGDLGAYRVWNDQAEAEARLASSAFDQRKRGNALQGMLFGIKDVFGVDGVDTFGGTGRRWPSRWNREGNLVKSIRQKGAVLTGKISCVEFAFGLVGTSRAWPTPVNPWSSVAQRVPGGSTSGGGVAVTTGLASAVLGSDAGGSIRVPAALTGTVGIKLSADRWPDEGRPPLCPTQDRLGLIARTAADLSFVFDALDGARSGRESPGNVLKGLRVGIPQRRFWDEADARISGEVEKALQALEANGAIMHAVSLTDEEEVEDLRTAGALAPAECFEFICREFPAWIPGIEPDVWARLTTLGRLPLAERERRSRRIERVRDTIRQRFAEIADVLVMPTVRIPVPLISDVSSTTGYRAANQGLGLNTYPFNIWDLPAISMPVGLDGNDMPVGMQLVGNHGSDRDLIVWARAFEQILGAASQRLGRPPLLKQFFDQPSCGVQIQK